MMSVIIPASGFLSKYTQSFLNQDSDSNLGKLWTCIGTQIDEIEAQITLLKSILDFVNQTGQNLDNIGDVLNTPRSSGQTDAEYIISLLTAVAENISTGALPDILNVITILKQGDLTKNCRIQETYPAAFQLYTNMIELTTGTQAVLQQARAAGIEIDITYSTSIYPFVFLGDSSGKGFGGTDGADGGDFSEIA